MKRLFQKMIRDMSHAKAQFISIFIMCFIGMLIYTGIEGAWKGMENQKNIYFDKTNLADFWINGTDFNESEIADIKKLDGVTDAQLSNVVSAYTNHDDSNTIRLIANDENIISKPMIKKGNAYDQNGSGIWLDAEYAQNMHMKVGDEITVYLFGKEDKLKVNGLIYSPEYISYTGSTSSLMPNHTKYTYGFVSSETLKVLCGEMKYNQIKIKLKHTYDTTKLKAGVKSILLGHYINGIDRTEWGGVSGFINKLEQIKKLSFMFSFVFFLLALLIIQTTMKRMVKQQRTQIGILKGLGFYNSQIKIHFSLYGLLVSLIGVSAGLFIAPYALTPVLLNLQKNFYSMPVWIGKVSYISYVLAILMILVCTFTALFACNKIVKELPAISLRDETAVHGKKIALENLRVVWNRIDFDWKWTIREMFHNKTKSMIAIIAILGSMVLLMASFGIKDSITKVNENIYGEQYSYYEKMNVQNMNHGDKSRIENLLQGAYQWGYEGSAEITSSSFTKTAALSVLDKGIYVSLINHDGTNVRLPKDGVVLSQKVAKDLRAAKNQTISIRIGGKNTPVVVSGIIDMNSQGIYISKTAWEKLGSTFSPNTLYAGNSTNLNKIEDMDCIGEAITLSEQLHDANKVLDSVNIIVILLLASAILLSIVILYNLGMLSYTERSREYATLKVLGFYNREIKSLIWKDTITNIIIGWFIGLPIGIKFLDVYVQAVSTTAVQYHGELKLVSFLIASIITIGCSLLVCYIACYKVAKLDMVQSLKSVE